MENQTKTPVEIVQELIAIHTTRKEAIDKLKARDIDENAKSRLTTANQQSDQFIAELMNELSNYGDGVSAGVDHDNEYQVLWKKNAENLDAITPAQSDSLFTELDNSLKKIYNDITQNKTELPVSLKEILMSHTEKLS